MTVKAFHSNMMTFGCFQQVQLMENMEVKKVSFKNCRDSLNDQIGSDLINPSHISLGLCLATVMLTNRLESENCAH